LPASSRTDDTKLYNRQLLTEKRCAINALSRNLEYTESDLRDGGPLAPCAISRSAYAIIKRSDGNSELLDRLPYILRVESDSLSAQANARQKASPGQHIDVGARNSQHYCDFLGEDKPFEIAISFILHPTKLSRVVCFRASTSRTRFFLSHG